MYLAQPFIWIRLLWKSKRVPSYRKNYLERYGFYPNKTIKPNGIVLHAVSLREMLLTKPLILELKKNYPDTIITLTSMTPSGLTTARTLQLIHHHIQCIYLPYDLPCAMKRFINTIKPKLVIVIETELWPNLINTLYQNKIPLIIANARLSYNSFIKYNKIRHFLFYILKHITIIAAQHKDDADRFLKLGFKKTQLHIIGNLKFDITITQDLLKKKLLKNIWIKNRLTWIASSTYLGEETILLQAHKTLLTIFPNLLMIIVPRHPERFIDIIKIIKKLKLSYIIQNNTLISINNIEIIIHNTIGNLMVLYSVSDIAFIGGSLVRHGGHNPLEPAAYAIPIIMGPYTFNFNSICKKLHEANGLIYVTDTTSLVHVITRLLKNRKNILYHGNCAIKVLKNNQGALHNLMKIIHNHL